MEKKLVSVVITSYKRERKYIEEAINSVKSQTYPYIEIIVVDDNGEDARFSNELRNICSESGVLYLKNFQNMGAQYSRNIGIINSHGAYVAFLDDDDIWMPEKIEKQLALFTDSEVGMVFCDGYSFEDGNLDHKWEFREASIYDRPISSRLGCVIMVNDFKGRNAIITGGGSGIGFEIAKQLLVGNIDNVVLIGRNGEKLQRAKTNLGSQYNEKIRTLRLDISDTENMLNVMNDYLTNLPFKVDILVNNAGVMCQQLFPLITEDEFDRVMNTNIKAVFFLSQLFSKYMIRNEIKGNILMVGSTSSARPAINPYMLSKWAIRGLTSGLAKALIPYGIVVNGIAPGPTATEMLGKDGSDLFNEKNPSKRYCTAEEVASLAIQLVGTSGRMIVGNLVYISGGAATITFDDQSYRLPKIN